MKRFVIAVMLSSLAFHIFSQEKMDPSKNKFRQMRTEFASPNAFRAASGAPGHLYWQQQANYQISIELDDKNHQIRGEERIEEKKEEARSKRR